MNAPLPGAEPHPPELARLLAAAEAHLPARAHGEADPAADAPRHLNRLALEKSPYLLQHARDPVDWWPWCDEAFERARRLGRPVFLSVGYSTCHWCHVMEHESFQDPEIARLLNSRFVAVKVDREERPDVDQIYMTAVQLLTGGGGWPMSVWLTADREPFFGGTYFPPRDGARGAARGFLSILGEIDAVWTGQPDRIGQATRALVEAVRAALGPAGAPSAGVPGPAVIDAAAAEIRGRYDPANGGLRGAPKFPSSLPVRLLLRHHRRTGDARSLEMAVTTLEKMAGGGIHDQLAGGFHRYSTDERWRVPHFEKMLYDNALLAVAYAEAWQATGRPGLARVLRTTLDYLVRELALPGGGFASATDADAAGVEGRTFAWSAAELREVLGGEADRLGRFHGVAGEGELEGLHLLHAPRPDEDEWEALAGARALLLARRDARPQPARDDKVLAGWNGLAITALAVGGRVLAEPRWIDAAARAADFVLAELVLDGRLQRAWRGGRAGPPAFLDDHAFLAAGLLDLYEATFDRRWLARALALAEELERRFADPSGGWFATAEDHERLLAREKPTHDGAEPAGGSVAALLALRLALVTGEERWRERGERALRAAAPTLAAAPTSLAELLLAVDLAADLAGGTARELVLVWPEGSSPAPLLAPLRRLFLPSRALLGAPEGEAVAALARLAPPAAGKVAVGGRPTAYLCEQGRCRQPEVEPDRLAAALGAG